MSQHITCPIADCAKRRFVVPWKHRAGTYACGCGAGHVVLTWTSGAYGGAVPEIRVATPEEARAWQEVQP